MVRLGRPVGYVGEILEGDDLNALDAKWLPITEIRGREVVTPERVINEVEEPVHRSKRSVLDDMRSRSLRDIEHDESEIARLREEARVARRRVARLDALLSRCED